MNPNASVTSGVQIVPMVKGQLREIMKIDKQVYPEPWSKALWQAELGRGTDARNYVVAQQQGKIVGYAGVLRTGDEAHVVTIVTNPNVQQRGVGTTLMLALSENAITWGCTGLTLEVRASNAAAQALYRRFGMAPVGVRKNYYKPNNEDALIMWAYDIDQPDFANRLDLIRDSVGENK